MFELLVASRPPREMRRWTWSGPAAVIVHALVIAGALWSTSGSAAAVPRSLCACTPLPPLVLLSPRVERAAPRPPEIIDTPVGTVPGDDIPILGPLPSFDPGFGAVLRAAGPTPWLDATAWAVGAPDEPPDLLSAPLPAYPEPLRRAGVTGLVVIEAVIDTVARAEPGTIRVVTSAHQMFEAAAREAVRRALFRPARVGGRAVRALVRVPVEFRLT